MGISGLLPGPEFGRRKEGRVLCQRMGVCIDVIRRVNSVDFTGRDSH